MITTTLPLIVTLTLLSVRFCCVYSATIDDLPPAIPAAFIHLAVPEDAEVGKILTYIGSPTVRYSKDIILYSITNDTGGHFYISCQGELQLLRPLDRETTESHDITIIVRNAVYPFKSSLINIIIDVHDVRDSVPVFKQSLIDISIPEDFKVGAQVMNVSADSEDSLPLIYSIVGGWGETSFRIDSSSGELTLAKPLKYNVRPFHRIIIRASNGRLTAYATVNITVINKQIPPEFTSTNYVFAVSSSVGTGDVIGHVMATDRDNEGCGLHTGITYSTNSFIIQVDQANGTVTLLTNDTLLVSHSVSETVIATASLQSSSTNVTIVLNNGTSPSSTVLPLGSRTIPKNSPVGTVLISNTRLDSTTSYTIHGDCGQFSLNASSGEVTTITRPLIVGTYMVFIVIEDMAINATISVTVSDENSPPYFDQEEYQLSVIENSPISTIIYQFIATDIEEGIVMYSSTDIPSSLSISSDGLLSVRENIDYESNTKLTFTITATDGDFTSQVGVVLEVLDVNNHFPTFVSSSNGGVLLENQPPGTVVTVVTAIDKDSGLNGVVSYSMVGDADDLFYFDISPTNGTISTKYPVDYEHVQSFTLIVRASDNGIPRHHVDTPVVVTVRNIPDNSPVFTDPYYSIMLEQTTPIGTPLTTVHAIADNTTSIRYRLNDTSLFIIDELTGILSSVADIPPDLGDLSLTVVAVNGNTSASVPVLVSVVSSIPCELHPKLFVFSEFHVFLPTLFRLGNLSVTSEHAPATLSLEPSRHRSEQYFMITGDTVLMLPTVTSGIHKLNVSIDTKSGRWFDEIEIRVALLTNASIEHHVSFLLPNFHLDGLSSHILDTFLHALSSHVVTCSMNQLQLVSVQGTDNGTELALVVLESDLVSTIPKERYFNELLYHIDLLQSAVRWNVIVLDSYVCQEMSCDYFQQCVTSLKLYRRHNPFTTNSISISTMLFDVQPSCVCPHGFNTDCSQQIDHCDPNPCHLNGICHNLVGGYECQCPTYTSGKNCTIACPSTSCDICTVTPCLHGTVCSIQLNGKQYCQDCSNEIDRGPRCEMTASSFYGDGFVEYSLSSVVETYLFLNFTFATVSPNGRLMYIGNFIDSDYLSIDLVSGSLTVSARMSNNRVHTVLSSKGGLLSDGRWHTVSLKVEGKTISVSINFCIPDNDDFVLEDQETWCHSHIEMMTSIGVIPFNTPVYFGGLPSSFVPFKAHPFDYYTGCIKNVHVYRHLIDFINDVHKVGNVLNGCHQTTMEGSCEGGCSNCLKGLWNGATCIDDLADSKSLNGNGYITLVPDGGSNYNLNISRFQFQLRTYQENIALSQINKDTHIHISSGSVIFSNMPNSVTLIANAYVSDGNWHSVDLLITPTNTTITIDNGRVTTSTNKYININTTEIVIGGIVEMEGVVRGLDGCVQGFQVNDEQLTVSSEESVGTMDGCSNTSCNLSSCPPDSSNSAWRKCTCECKGVHIPIDGECMSPCIYCNEDGISNCLITEYFPYFSCICGLTHHGTTCHSPKVDQCDTGYFFTLYEMCEPCPCDLRGVNSGVCDSKGKCFCAENTYSPSYGGDDTKVLGCQPCDCHPLGSTSLRCDESTGQCTCKEGVGGQHCDTCLPGYVNLNENGCQVSSVIEGTFIVENVYCHETSTELSFLLDSLSVMILAELERFGLPSTQEIDIELEESSNFTTVRYSLSSYIALNASVLTAPTPHILAAMMQTIVRNGHIGVYWLAPDSHTVTSSCSVNPCPVDTNCTNMPINGAVVCSGCPEDTILDGIVCRPPESKSCNGTDSDLDGVADICDSCPFYFNPDQEESNCVVNDRVCPSEVAMEILWTVSEPGYIDNKDCPSPLQGIATRYCNDSGLWTEPDLSNCLTRFGEETKLIISSLTSNPPADRADTTSLLNYFSSLVISNESPTVGDMRTYQTLLDSFLSLDTLLPPRQDNLYPLGKIIDNMISDNNDILWSMVGHSGTSGVLATVEEIGKLSAQFATEAIELQMNGIEMTIINESLFNGVRNEVDSTDSSVSIPEGVISAGSLGVSMVYLPTIVDTLPQPSLPNISAGAPVWSLNLASRSPTNTVSVISTLDMPINITFPHIYPLEYVNEASVICATWDTESLEWIDDGCLPVLVTVNYTTCSCPHLSTFTLLQNLSVEAPPASPPPIPTQGNSPSVISLVLFGVSCVILAVCLVILIILYKYQKEQPFSEIWIQLVLSILIFFILFVVGLYLAYSESDISCAIVGLLLGYFPLVTFTLFLIGGIAVVMKQKWLNNTILKCIASGIAWVVPLLYIVVCGIIIKFTTSLSFSESLGYPEYCWISFSYSFLFFPILLLVVPSFIIFVTTLIYYPCCSPEKNHSLKDLSSFSVHFIIVILLFLLLWIIMCGVFYLNTTLLQYISSIIASILSITVFIIVLLKAGLSDFIKLKFRVSTSIELEMRRKSFNNSSISSRTPFRRRHSSLPSLPGEEEPEYHTISAVRRLPPALPDHHPMHSLQVELSKQTSVNLLHESGSDNDGEVERILHQTEGGVRGEDDVMMQNEGYGVTMPPLQIGNIPNVQYQEVDQLQPEGEPEEEDNQWFKGNVTCSPIHVPFSPSSSTTATPLPHRAAPNTTTTTDEDAEIDRLYQLTRISTRPSDDTSMYAEIRVPKESPPPPPPPPYSSCADTPPWYTSNADSDINYSITNKSLVVQDERWNGSQLSPPPSIPPRPTESPDSPNIISGSQLYAEIDSIQPLPQDQRRMTISDGRQSLSIGNRCSSLSHENVKSRSTSVSALPPNSTPSSRPSYPFGSLDRRSSQPHQQQHRMNSISNIGNHSQSQQHTLLRMNQNGSQTFQSLV